VDVTGGVRLGITPGLWWSPLSLVFISVWLADGEVLDGDIPKNKWIKRFHTWHINAPFSSVMVV